MTGSIPELIELFARLPGVGKRSATRLVFHMLEASPEYAARLGEAVASFHSRICKCGVCANVSDDDPCSICEDKSRDQGVICVVENVPDLWAVDSGGTYRGVFHVLHGLLAPLDGIGPDDLNIDLLAKRVNESGVKEVIVATRPSVEGEATAMLIRQGLKDSGVKITRIASGVPHGSELEYTDSRTLERAISDRREF